MENIFRKLHLDGHLAPDICDIGKKFDKKEFQERLIKGNVQEVVLFAKCHHGHTYYPSKVSKVHPYLDFDLLGQQIEAAHEIGVRAMIYITLGWNMAEGIEHPEWLVHDYETGEPKSSFYNYKDTFGNPDKTTRAPYVMWLNLCPNTEYFNVLTSITEEICDRYHPVDGVFYDICFAETACACEACKKQMIEKGLDFNNKEDAKAFYKEKRIELLKTLHNIVKTNSPNATVFFNGSCEIVNDGVYYLEYQQYNTHYEIEELASGTGDYDKVCLKAKYFENFGKPIYGMTGKFHLTWGEFGGYKSDNALKYECAYSLSLGIGMSIGDQIHPSGKMDEYTYELIGKAYSFYKGLENVCLPSKSVCDFGFVFSSDNETNNGLNHLLLELKVDYTIFNEDSNIANFKCVIIPDATQLSDALLAKIKAYYKNGGKLFVSGEAIKYFSETGIAYLGKSNCDVDYILCEDIISSPCVSYLPAHITNPGTNKILSSVYKPYYNRTIEHFCSHMHSPNKLEKEDYPASIKCENLIYVAHDLFKEYEQYGQEYIKNYFNLFLSELYNDRILSCEGLQSLGRIRLRDNEVQSKLLLHILYAPPIKRGAAFVIEDFPTVKNVKVQIKTDKKIKKVYSETTNENIPFQCSEGKIYVTVPEFACYELISLEY